jgi:hypothetical protein
MMNFSLGSIIANLIFGAIGLWVLNQGRKQTNFNYVICGLLMMIYPIFVSGTLANWAVGGGICLLCYWIENK